MLPNSLTEADIARFRADGFIKLKHVLSPTVINYYAPVITAEVYPPQHDALAD